MSHMSEAHVHMMEKFFHDEEDWKNQVSNFVQHFLDVLSERDQQIILSRFGLRDGRGKTLSELSLEHGVSQERIRQIEIRALRKLRRNGWPKIPRNLSQDIDKESAEFIENWRDSNKLERHKKLNPEYELQWTVSDLEGLGLSSEAALRVVSEYIRIFKGPSKETPPPAMGRTFLPD